jgi:hypothetical protein
MPRRYAAETLPPDQLKFVLDHIVAGETDREISFAFEDEFKDKLSKSGLARWRKAAGNELADRYRMARYQAKQLIEDLKEEPDVDKHQLVVASIEDRLLTATHEVMSQDPFKLLIIQQEEKRRELRARELDLKERAQQFAEDQARKSETLEKDRFGIGADTWRFILAYMKEKDPTAVDVLLKHNAELLQGLETYLAGES